jgi:hypothetical protein
MKLQDKAVLIRVPRELVELMQIENIHYTTKMTEILMAHYNLTFLQIRKTREINNDN